MDVIYVTQTNVTTKQNTYFWGIGLGEKYTNLNIKKVVKLRIFLITSMLIKANAKEILK